MNREPVALALGTAQFGMKYGIAGRSEPVPKHEIEAILADAWDKGVRVIDTAPVYGTIESELGALTQGYDFRFVSKIPALPKHCSQEELFSFLKHSIELSQRRFGERLSHLLFHQSSDLLSERGEEVWTFANKCLARTPIELGVSCYCPDELGRLEAKLGVHVAQFPANALDQRIHALDDDKPYEVYVRSVFLQGLLLMSLAHVAQTFPHALPPIQAWHAWCKRNGLTPLQAALGVIKGMPRVSYAVVGVDSQWQLNDILETWLAAKPLIYPDFISDLTVIDPRCWSLTS